MDGKAVRRTLTQNLKEWFARPAGTPEGARRYLERTIPEHNIAKTMRETVSSIYDLFTSPFVAGASVLGKVTGMAVRAPFAIPSAIGWGLSNTLIALGAVPLQIVAATSDKIGHALERGPATLVPERINEINKSVRNGLQRVLGLEGGTAPAGAAA